METSVHVLFTLFTLRRTAEDNSDDKDVIFAIDNNTYMDDLLQSTKTVDDAIRLAIQIQSTLRNGDFNLHDWCSNSREFLDGLRTETDYDTQKFVLSHDVNDNNEKKILGVIWIPQQDVFTFNIRIPSLPPKTLREVTSNVASIFDPLGFSSPITVVAKIELRKLGTLGYRWDDPIHETHLGWWDTFKTAVDATQFTIPRHLYPQKDRIMSRELHIFNDASIEANASVIYLRTTYNDGSVNCNIV